MLERTKVMQEKARLIRLQCRLRTVLLDIANFKCRWNNFSQL